jgi:hypothetical protein
MIYVNLLGKVCPVEPGLAQEEVAIQYRAFGLRPHFIFILMDGNGE